jgi:hypothetical protein
MNERHFLDSAMAFFDSETAAVEAENALKERPIR